MKRLKLIETNYGGRRAFLRHIQTTLAAHCGGWNRYAMVDWSRAQRLVFVCKGNICRSPYAEAFAQTLGMSVRSFGLEVTQSRPAHHYTRAIAERQGLWIAQHQSRPLTAEDLLPDDLVVAFEPDHLPRLLRICAGTPTQVTLLGFHTRPARLLIFDPYGHSPASFEYCFRLIASGCSQIASNIAGHQKLAMPTESRSRQFEPAFAPGS